MNMVCRRPNSLRKHSREQSCVISKNDRLSEIQYKIRFPSKVHMTHDTYGRHQDELNSLRQRVYHVMLHPSYGRKPNPKQKTRIPAASSLLPTAILVYICIGMDRYSCRSLSSSPRSTRSKPDRRNCKRRRKKLAMIRN